MKTIDQMMVLIDSFAGNHSKLARMKIRQELSKLYSRIPDVHKCEHDWHLASGSQGKRFICIECNESYEVK